MLNFNNFRKIIIILFWIHLIICVLFGIDMPYWEASVVLLDTGDNEELSSFKGESSDQGNDSKGKSSESTKLCNQQESSTDHSLDKSTDKNTTPPFRSRTIISSDGPSPYDDIQKRLERMMLNHTQDFLNKGNQQIKDQGLQFKDEADLTQEEKELLDSRDKDAKFLAETSANLSKMELKDLTRDTCSMDTDSKKRFLEESSDNNPHNKKSK